MTDQYDPNGAYSEVFDEGLDLQQAQTIHRIRANSTIMKLKKILGEFRSLADPRVRLGCGKLVLIYPSTVANRGEIRMHTSSQAHVVLNYNTDFV